MSEKDAQLEKELWSNYRKDKSLENRNKLVEYYADIVNYVAGRIIINMPPNVEFEDLVSYGVLGLIDAIDKFDESRGFKFNTYASVRIRGSILDEIRTFDWVPRAVRKKARKLQKAYLQYESKMGKLATDEDIAQYLNISLDDFYKMLNEISGTSQLSLDTSWSVGKDNDETSLMASLAAPETINPEVMLTRVEVKKEIIETINDLPEKERLVLALYYYENLTLKEIGEVLELTESRVSQIHVKAMSILKSRLVERLGYGDDF